MSKSELLMAFTVGTALLEGGDTRQAEAELLFFVRAWASPHPDFRATVLPA